MSSKPHDTEYRRSRRIFVLVQRRRDDPSFSATQDGYARLAVQLPHLLHHNGLAHTLNYLNFLHHSRHDLGAGALLADWWSPTDTRDGLHIAQILPPRTGTVPSFTPAQFNALVSDSATYRLASRLARREAVWFKRYAQSVLDTGTRNGHSQPHSETGEHRNEPH